MAVITCVFSKWIEVLLLTNKEALTVTKAVIKDWIVDRGWEGGHAPVDLRWR
jgi:hypothetical protein